MFINFIGMAMAFSPKVLITKRKSGRKNPKSSGSSDKGDAHRRFDDPLDVPRSEYQQDESGSWVRQTCRAV
jgi:hypothetical protein